MNVWTDFQEERRVPNFVVHNSKNHIIMADTVIYDPSSQNQGMNGALPWLLAGQNGGFGGMNNAWPWLFAMNGGMGFGGFGGAGLGMGLVGFILGALINNGGGFGNLFGGGNGSGTAFLSNQISGDTGRELIMNAINGTDADVRLLATTLNADVNEVRSALSTVQLAIQNVGSQVGMTGQQLINAIQAGNAALSHQLCECCCNMRQQVAEQGYQNQLRTVEQTNTLGTAITAGNQRIVDAIADLKTTTVKEFCDARERDMQAEINNKADLITQLRSKADNAEQTQRFLGAFAVLDQKITELAAKQPQTVPVTWPNLAAVNTTPYVSGGYYQGGFNGFYGPGVGGRWA